MCSAQMTDSSHEISLQGLACFGTDGWASACVFVFACVGGTCVSGGKHADVSECMQQPEVNLGVILQMPPTSLEETGSLTGLDSPGRLIWL